MAVHSDGYIIVRGGYEHRVVWEAAHGPIPPGMHVHHKNGVRDDNRLENLELIDPREHGREHAYEGHAARWNYSPGGPCHVCGGSNWRYRSSGRRDCRTCEKRRAVDYTPPLKTCPHCGLVVNSSLARHIRRKHAT